MGKRKITEKEIEAARTPEGGFTAARLEQWGVPWPPPPGWKKRLIVEGVEGVEGVETTPDDQESLF